MHDRSWNCLWLCNITLFEKYQIIKFVDDSIFIESVDILLDFYYYTHTVSFGIMMALFLLFVFTWKERDNYKGMIYGILLGIVIYAGMKIRITNLILCMAVLISVFFFGKRKRKGKTA